MSDDYGNIDYQPNLFSRKIKMLEIREAPMEKIILLLVFLLCLDIGGRNFWDVCNST